MRNDGPICRDGGNGVAGYFPLFPDISLASQALAGRANFGEMGDLIDHQSGIATDRANQRGGAWRNCRAI
jgi:hypothetical protein